MAQLPVPSSSGVAARFTHLNAREECNLAGTALMNRRQFLASFAALSNGRCDYAWSLKFEASVNGE